MADSATLEDASIGPNVHVMANATLVDTDVERSVIFSDVTVEATTVRRSIIDGGVRLGAFDLHDAMIGAYTQIPDGSEE